jgi:putative two-component system response regulator
VSAPRKVLIVDDEESMRLLLERILQPVPDLEITLAGSCDEAVLRVGSGQYDLILLDLLMPGIGGLEVLKIIRTSVANRRTPVIVVSVLADPDTAIVCRSLGIGDYVVKPVVRDTLLAAVKAQLAAPQKTSNYGA